MAIHLQRSVPRGALLKMGDHEEVFLGGETLSASDVADAIFHCLEECRKKSPITHPLNQMAQALYEAQLLKKKHVIPSWGVADSIEMGRVIVPEDIEHDTPLWDVGSAKLSDRDMCILIPYFMGNVPVFEELKDHRMLLRRRIRDLFDAN